jgi:hypothetical protein
MDKKPFNQFDCWVADGPIGNFLLHSKSTRPDGSFEYLCQSFDSVEQANFVGQHLANEMRKALENDGAEIVEEEETWIAR